MERFRCSSFTPAGRIWKNKDDGAWMIPKGEIEPDEDPLAAAKREFREETGFEPAGPFIPLTAVTHKSGKVVHAWAFEGDCDPGKLRSNTFTMEWPPKSGKHQQFPEIDRASFFSIDEARRKILPDERPLIDELARLHGS
jgi:predicted NUDIX family NTP pyrophosphohydrolase